MPELIIDRDEVCFYVTEKCNSNCVMCPMSLDSRKRGREMSAEEWEHFEEMIPPDTAHITVTGGEPFLCGGRLFAALEKINRLYPAADVLVLTNGRALAIPEIAERLAPLITERYCFAIPVHGPDAALHDRITASPGSFRQALAGIRFLGGTEAKTEVRIVGHRMNIGRISDTFRMLSRMKARIDVINLVAMEMTGCAARNRAGLWVDYDILCEQAEEGIRQAVLSGIDAGLYNFPLCQVPEGLWPLARHSITPYKVRYPRECEGCARRDACGGMFYSTCLLGLCRVRPFKKEAVK